jgi:hypothetical protein
MCEAQPPLSEAAGSFVDRHANWLNAGPRTTWNGGKHTDAAMSGHDGGRAPHVTRTSTSDYGMQQ